MIDYKSLDALRYNVLDRVGVLLKSLTVAIFNQNQYYNLVAHNVSLILGYYFLKIGSNSNSMDLYFDILEDLNAWLESNHFNYSFIPSKNRELEWSRSGVIIQINLANSIYIPFFKGSLADYDLFEHNMKSRDLVTCKY